MNRFFRTWPRLSIYDIIAGISVALVAVPQALAYAELAHMPAHTGLYAVAVAAIAAAFFASSPYLQTGPVAATALLTFGILSQIVPVETPTYIAAAGLLAVMVGVIRIAVGVLRLGQIAYLLAYPVLLGFTTAAALLIIASQLPTALGVRGVTGTTLGRAVQSLLQVQSWQPAAIILCLATIALSHYGRRLHPLFPGVLIAFILGILYSQIAQYSGAVIGTIQGGFPPLNLALPFELIPTLLIGAVVIALIGFSEAASVARTYATIERQRWDANQEFISQGVANLAAGLFSGFPVGGSFSRSALNRLAGAKSRWSGLVTGLTVMAALPLTPLIASLPLAVLAGIIIAATLSLLRFRELALLRKYSSRQAVIAWLTFALTLLLAPRIDYAVLIGIGLAIAHHLRREQRVVIDIWTEGQSLHFRPQGVLWFGSAATVEAALNEALEKYQSADELILHLGNLGRIDVSAALMLKQLMDDAKAAGLKVQMVDTPAMAKRWMKRVWRLEE